jgi:hypothetical protein
MLFNLYMGDIMKVDYTKVDYTKVDYTEADFIVKALVFDPFDQLGHL